MPVRFDHPDSGFAAQNTKSVGKYDSIQHFVELMKFSDVVINSASTTTLDAILFDTPAICPIFNFKVSADSWNSAYAHHYESSHFCRVVESGAVELPANVQELSDAITRSLSTPNQLQSKRDSFVEDMMPNLPTAQLIKEVIEKVLANN
jgi:hypothetical protein